MFQSVEELSQKLSETGYFIDPTMTKVVFLADQMKKPPGVSEEQAIGRFDESLQRLLYGVRQGTAR